MKDYNNQELDKIKKLNLPIPHLSSLLSLLDERQEDFSRFRKNMENLTYYHASMPSHHKKEPIEIAIFPKSLKMKDYFQNPDDAQNRTLYDCFLLHELYHLKDLEREKDGSLSTGFTKISPNGIYQGLGINEGCIELFVFHDLKLNRRSLVNLKPYLSLNEVEVILTSMISDMVGENNLRTLQTKHDIASICSQLEVLSNPKQAEDIILLLDRIKGKTTCFRKNARLYPTEEIDMCARYLLEMGRKKSEETYQKLEEKEKILTKLKK